MQPSVSDFFHMTQWLLRFPNTVACIGTWSCLLTSDIPRMNVLQSIYPSTVDGHLGVSTFGDYE